jgi:chromosome segregation ATPase
VVVNAAIAEESLAPATEFGLPCRAAELDWFQQRMRVLTQQREAAEREAAALRRDLESLSKALGALLEHVEAPSGREKQLREMLADAHQQLCHRDAEIRTSVRDLAAQRDALLREREFLNAEREFLRAHLGVLEARLDSIRRSLPGRLYRGFRKLLRLGKR